MADSVLGTASPEDTTDTLLSGVPPDDAADAAEAAEADGTDAAAETVLASGERVLPIFLGATTTLLQEKKWYIIIIIMDRGVQS